MAVRGRTSQVLGAPVLSIISRRVKSQTSPISFLGLSQLVYRLRSASLPTPPSIIMDYNNPYAPPSTYQVDNSLMRPANLPPLSMQTIGSDRSSGFRNGGHPPYGGAGPDRNAPRRGGFRGGASRGRPPPGRGGRDFPDRGGNDFQGNHNGWNNNAPSGGYDRNGYQGNGYQGDYGNAPAPAFGQGGYAGNQGNSYGRDSGFAPPRNEFDGELCCFPPCLSVGIGMSVRRAKRMSVIWRWRSGLCLALPIGEPFGWLA